MSAKNPVLVILAAGMGSRFGGLKQLEPVGVGGETLLDYSIYDALRAGFREVVFVIRPTMETAFRDFIKTRYPSQLAITLAFQSVDDVPAGVSVPENREKPWGTAHAVWSAREAVGKRPFAVINADDYYGSSAFSLLYDYLHSQGEQEAYCMVAYQLGQTLSASGSVSRGVCQVDEQGKLLSIDEHTRLVEQEGKIISQGAEREPQTMPANALVSMNCWGFTAHYLERLESFITDYFANQPDLEHGECYLPNSVMAALSASGCDCRVFRTEDRWCGITYPTDLAHTRSYLAQMVQKQLYPAALFPDKA